MIIRFVILTAISSLIFGCSIKFSSSDTNTKDPQTEQANVAKVSPTITELVDIEDPKTTPKKSETVDKTSCSTLQRDDLALDQKQTFAIDFKPFEKSCFVTFHDPEFDNPPLRSQFFIYQNGREVFNFPAQFGGGNTSCWVEAVAFEDLNNDQLKDVIVIGKCGEKSGAYHENMVYLNNGREFVTNPNSNAETMDFNQIGQIRDFVRKNPQMFVP